MPLTSALFPRLVILPTSTNLSSHTIGTLTGRNHVLFPFLRLPPRKRRGGNPEDLALTAWRLVAGDHWELRRKRTETSSFFASRRGLFRHGRARSGDQARRPFRNSNLTYLDPAKLDSHNEPDNVYFSRIPDCTPLSPWPDTDNATSIPQPRQLLSSTPGLPDHGTSLLDRIPPNSFWIRPLGSRGWWMGLDGWDYLSTGA